LKLPLMLVLLVVGQNHANLSKINKEKLAKYRQMLEKAELAAAGNDTDTTVTEGTPKNRVSQNVCPPDCPPGEWRPPPDLENRETGNSTKVDHPDPGGNKNRKCDDVADCVEDAPADLENRETGNSTTVDHPDPGGNKNRECEDEYCDVGRPNLNNTAGDSTKTDQKQLGQLIKSILGQLSSGNPVKMVVDIKNPEVMIDKNEVDTGKMTEAEKMAKASRQISPDIVQP